MKNFYKENRVFSILMIIAIICLLLIVGFFLIYFFKGQSSNKYGSRLDGIDKVKISDKKISEYEVKVKEEKGIESVEVVIQGKIVYVTLHLDNESAVNDGVNASLKTINNFTYKYLSFYYFNFIIYK